MMEMIRPLPEASSSERRRMAAMDRAVQASIDLLVPLFGRGVIEALSQHETGIVDQNIKPAKFGFDAGHHAFDGLEIGDIGLEGLGFSTGLYESGQQRLPLHPGTNDNLPPPQRPLRRGPAKSPRRHPCRRR